MSLRYPRLVVIALALFAALPPIARADDTVAQQGVKSTVWVIARLDGDRIMIGSGAVIDTGKKLVVTNYHLLVNSKGVLVVFPKYENGKVINDREVYINALRMGHGVESKVFAEDKAHDLALVQVDTIPADVPALKLAKEGPGPGDKVHSIGSPGGMAPAFAHVESSVKQQVNLNWRLVLGMNMLPLNFTAKVLELSAPANAGDSGGPLLSEKGNLVGVACGLSSPTFYIDIAEVKVLLQSKMIEPMIAADDPGVKPAKPAEAMAKADPKVKDAAKGKNNAKAKPAVPAKTTDPAKRESEASLKLDQARKGDPAKALDIYRDIVKNYADTKAAEEAKPLLEKAEAEKREADAYVKLDLARDLEKTGNAAKAQQRYREIVKEYSGTKAAEEAQKLIDKK